LTHCWKRLQNDKRGDPDMVQVDYLTFVTGEPRWRRIGSPITAMTPMRSQHSISRLLGLRIARRGRRLLAHRDRRREPYTGVFRVNPAALLEAIEFVGK
jgi:hypothetical protein